MEFPVKPRLAPQDGPDEIMHRLGFKNLGQAAESHAVDALILHQHSSAGRITIMENYQMVIAGVHVAHASLILQNGQATLVTLLNKPSKPELHQISLAALTHGTSPLSNPLTKPQIVAEPPQELVRLMPDKSVIVHRPHYQA